MGEASFFRFKVQRSLIVSDGEKKKNRKGREGTKCGVQHGVKRGRMAKADSDTDVPYLLPLSSLCPIIP